MLLDENMPHDLRPLFAERHDVFTVDYLKWHGLKNGRLLQAAAENGFEVMITFDQNIQHEQDLGQLPLSVILVIERRPRDQHKELGPLVDAVLEVIDHLQPLSHHTVTLR